MKGSLVLHISCVAVLTSATLFPTASPTTTTQDPYECATESLTEFFEPPRPTGDLSSAIQSWGLALGEEEPCTLKGLDATLNCPAVESARWCQFTTAAPESVLPAWSEYVSSASNWWAERSATAVQLASQCPRGWYNAIMGMGAASQRLNGTIITGQCLSGPNEAAEASPTDDELVVVETEAVSSSPPAGLASVTAPPASEPTNSAGRVGGIRSWVVAGTAIAVAGAVSII
jgi:hypothetical protein